MCIMEPFTKKTPKNELNRRDICEKCYCSTRRVFCEMIGVNLKIAKMHRTNSNRMDAISAF